MIYELFAGVGHVAESAAHDANADATPAKSELVSSVAVQQRRLATSPFVSVDQHVVLTFQIASIPRALFLVAAQV